MGEYEPPNSPPPKNKPKKPRTSYIIDCVHQYTYVWPKKGKTFWFYSTRIEEGVAKPVIRTDNGPQFVSIKFRDCFV